MPKEGTILHKAVGGYDVKKIDDFTFEFTASTEARDRDNEVIEVDGWDLKNFRKNPVILFGHDYRGLPVARSPRVWIDRAAKKLKNLVEFPPEGIYEFADIVRRLVAAGFLKAESVGFMPKEWTNGDGGKEPYTTFLKQELLEISLVPVPAHPDALQDAIKAGTLTVKDIQTLTDSIPPDEEIVKRFNTWAATSWKCPEALAELEDGAVDKGAISYASAHPGGTPKAPEDAEWDAGAEVRAAEVSDLKIMCTWVGEDPEQKAAYKLPHHKAAGSHPCVWRAVAASAAVIMGARGGANIPESDMTGVKAHIAKHYKDFDKGDPPWVKMPTQGVLVDELDYVRQLIPQAGLTGITLALGFDVVREILRYAEGNIPDDIQEMASGVPAEVRTREIIGGILALPAEGTPIPKLPTLEEIAEMVSKEMEARLNYLRGKV